MSRQLTSGVLGRRKGIDADLQVYLGSLTTALSSGQVTLLNTFVKDLKSGLEITNLSDAFDVMYILANETSESGLKNLVKRTHDATLAGLDGLPVFAALEGFTGGTANAQRRRIETGFVPSTDGDNVKLDDASYGAYQRTTGTEFSMLFGVASTGHITLLENGQVTRVHSTSFDNVGHLPAGLTILSRAAAANYQCYRNKIDGTITRASTALPEHNIWLLGYNNAGAAPSANYGLNIQISLFFAGKSFTQSEVNIIRNTFEAYMDANGKGVIP